MAVLEKVVWGDETSPQIAPSLSIDKYNLSNDTELWDAFSKGDEGAFIRIYNDYFKELCDFGVQFASISMVEDAIQDLFIDLRRRRSSLPKLKRSIRLFLFQCLKRRIFNMLKKEKHSPSANLPEQMFGIAPSQESTIILNQEEKENFERLSEELSNLNERHREIIYYYFYKGMSYEEVQELLGFQDVKSARNLIYKIIKKLRKSFLSFF
ncbi:RNA polymerase sigma factor [Aestuariivivens insulae]|uniref:RNA polymerase sigma factor n=1 Tax=Aestuariivivens insulae TaxID=1621988 RepID=UPI001F56906B|nr:sigma-70 family RNA polymerase sigma factor [Aestuariivivens insulae]